MAVKGIVFDLDGVYLLRGKENFISGLKAKFGVSEADARRVFLKSPEISLYKQGKMTGDEFWAFACREWKIKAKKEELISLLVSGYEVSKEAEKLAGNLKTAGYKLLICTNNFRERLEGLEKKFKLSKTFDAIVASYQVGAMKPDRAIMDALAKRAGLTLSEIFFADDSLANVESARKLGVNAVLYEDFSGFVLALKRAGVKVEFF